MSHANPTTTPSSSLTPNDQRGPSPSQPPAVAGPVASITGLSFPFPLSMEQGPSTEQTPPAPVPLAKTA